MSINFEYGNLPYQYPLDESQPVLRIPVAGPQPFNTLVIVRQMALPGSLTWDDNDLNEVILTVQTPFKLIGYDPRVTPSPQHSTTIYLHLMESTDDFIFVIAINDVWAYVTDDGTWTLKIDTAALGAKYDSLGILESGPLAAAAAF